MSTETREKQRCPDGGRCHHSCGDGPCFRVRYCGPLSGVYPGDRWPAAVEAHAEKQAGQHAGGVL